MAHRVSSDHDIVLRPRRLHDLRENLGGIAHVTRWRERRPRQKLQRDEVVLYERCTDDVGVNLKQMGLLGTGFNERNKLVLAFIS